MCKNNHFFTQTEFIFITFDNKLMLNISPAIDPCLVDTFHPGRMKEYVSWVAEYEYAIRFYRKWSGF